ncbi:MAG: exonuclease domain-containing protein [Marinoscillum sp.]
MLRYTSGLGQNERISREIFLNVFTLTQSVKIKVVVFTIYYLARVFMPSSKNKLYAIIDTETTGGIPRFSRLTDISIFLYDGESIVDEFSSLINPEIPIPPFITQLTGIDDDMVSGAPLFEEIAQQVIEITQGAIFVAHNVNFDYGMLRSEFGRMRYDYQRPKLCTVRLARKYIPGHRSYGLGNICADLGIPINGRHRARGDAEATVELFHLIYQEAEGHPTMTDEKWLTGLPVHMDRSVVDRLPETAGLFYFYDEIGKVVYIGASSNVFKKVTSLFTSKSKKSVELRSIMADIDFEETGSELIAKLKLPEAIDKHEPNFNSIPGKKSKWELTNSVDLFGYLHLNLMPAANGRTIGTCSFNTKKEGEVYLRKLVKQYQLCGNLCSIHAGSNCEKQGCMGACRQLEPVKSYNLRVEQALSQKTFSQSNFVILDQRTQSQQPFIMIEGHQYIGYGLIDHQDDAIDDLSALKDRLNVDNNSIEKMAIIQAYMIKHKPKIIAI